MGVLAAVRNSSFFVKSFFVASIAFIAWIVYPGNYNNNTIKSTSSLYLANEGRVLNVSVSGTRNKYSFAVSISSPDTGCDRYANWWEVITPQGYLIYRRILMHSHVKDQPFMRTGGEIKVLPDQKIIIRVHMFPDGYSVNALSGTVENGFQSEELPLDFNLNLARSIPLPTHCAF